MITTFEEAQGKMSQPSQSKAKEILRDGTVHGKSLTDKQRKFMGWIAGGAKAKKGNNKMGNK